MILYDTYRLRVVAYRENLLYMSRSEWRFYSEANVIYNAQ